MSKNTKEVLVLGAGLAGLSASMELVKKGYNVTILERFDFIGGLAATFEKNHFRFDTGPHRWFAKNNMVNKWMIDLMGPELIKVKRLTRIYFDGKYFYYPIRIKNALLGIGPVKSVEAVLDYMIYRIRGRILKPKIISLEDGYINQFGKTLYNTFFNRYSEKLWGRKNSQVSADWIGQRTRGFNILTVVKDAILKSRNVVSFVDEFLYPDRGVGRIAGRMAEIVKEKEGKIILNARVVGFVAKSNKIDAVEVLINGKKKIFKADEYINTIPITIVIQSLSPKPPKEIIDASKTLKYRSEVQVTLFVDKEKITPDVWIYVHPKEISFMRFMEMDNWSSKMQPKGKTAIVFEVACNEGDKMWNKSDEELIDIVKKDYIKEFKTVTDDQVLGGYVHRVPYEYPVYHIGYMDPLEKIKKYLSKFINFQTIGRNGIFRYNNMDHSIEMGLYAAWNIIEGKRKYDVNSVNIEREYLEEKKVK